MTDTLKTVVSPSLKQSELPEWLTTRGGDCRGFDRRQERHVYGPSHPFQEPTDVLAINGLVRFWPGSRGLPPYLNVQAFLSGSWRDVGTLLLSSDESPDVLVDAVLSRVTPDETTVRLSVRDSGDILCTLKRGHRGIFVQHGGTGFPDVISGRRVRWSGLPPHALAQDVHSVPGKFGRGLKASIGSMWADEEVMWSDPFESWESHGTGLSYVKFYWPPQVPPTAWSLPFYWLPRLDDDTQPNAGLFSLYDEDDEQVGKLEYLSASKTFRFTLGANTVSSPAHTFDAHDPLFVEPRFDTTSGMALTTKPAAVSHATNPAVDPAADSFIYLRWGLISDGSGAGDGDAGDGTAGGVGAFAEGDFDDAKLISDRTSDAEAADHANSSTHGLEDLVVPESRLVWYAPFAVRPVSDGSSLSDGLRYETQTDGVARKAYDGLTRGLAGLSGVTATSDFGVSRAGKSFDVFAFLATENDQDDVEDHQEQFAAANQQQVRVR